MGTDEIVDVLQGRSIYRSMQQLIEYKEAVGKVTKVSSNGSEAASRVKAHQLGGQDGKGGYVNAIRTETFCWVFPMNDKRRMTSLLGNCLPNPRAQTLGAPHQQTDLRRRTHLIIIPPNTIHKTVHLLFRRALGQHPHRRLQQMLLFTRRPMTKP
ncbi:hypothetical protein BDV23DRAFT_94978 [Aspergillus alliaceus]|uniref:Uncharacterized protein n=1 Tax=Petromyces alliaceus TaxID=209559 RepID=A0A5N7CMG9_PETAA|nr:hypothetical protein BDV23DRAFT_94978 [Aspergillus alliaceus]